MIISTPPQPPPIVQNCYAQIEAPELGIHAYKCLTQKQYDDSMAAKAADTKAMSDWIAAHILIIIGVLVVALVLIFFGILG